MQMRAGGLGSLGAGTGTALELFIAVLERLGST
jgi:hypothetical protein